MNGGLLRSVKMVIRCRPRAGLASLDRVVPGLAVPLWSAQLKARLRFDCHTACSLGPALVQVQPLLDVQRRKGADQLLAVALMDIVGHGWASGLSAPCRSPKSDRAARSRGRKETRPRFLKVDWRLFCWVESSTP